MSAKSTFRFFNSCLLLLLSCFFMQAQELNTTLIGHLPYPNGLSDIWGYTAPDGTEYALVGKKDGTSIVSLADHSNPVEVAVIPGDFSTWRDLKVWEDFAYVVDDQAGEGLLIIDLSNLPESIEYEYWFGTDEVSFTQVHNIFIDEFGYAYLFGGDYGVGGAIILDVTEDPWQPEIAGIYDTNYVHDGFVRDNIMWTSEYDVGLLAALDVSDKENIVLLGTAPTPGNASHNCWLSDDGTTIFTTDEISNGYIAAYDCTDYTDIYELDRIQSSPGEEVIPHNSFVYGDYLITSYYTDGLTVHDITEPDNLVLVGQYDSSPLTGDGFDGAWGVYPYLDSGLMLISDIQEGLFIVDVEFVRAAYLEGLVTDADTGLPINGVEVLSIASEPAFTNLQGEYKLGTVEAGEQWAIFSKPNYEPVSIEGIDMESGEIKTLNVEMQNTCGNTVCDIENAEDYCTCQEDCECSVSPRYLGDIVDGEPSSSNVPQLLCKSSALFGTNPNPDPAIAYIPFKLDGPSCVNGYNVSSTDGDIKVLIGTLLTNSSTIQNNMTPVLVLTQEDIDNSGGSTTVTITKEADGCFTEVTFNWAEIDGSDDLASICAPAVCGDAACDPGEDYCNCAEECVCEVASTYLEFTGQAVEEVAVPLMLCKQEMGFIFGAAAVNPDPATWYTLVGVDTDLYSCVGTYNLSTNVGQLYGLDSNAEVYELETLPAGYPQARELAILELTQADIDQGPVSITISAADGDCTGVIEYDFSSLEGADDIASICPASTECDGIEVPNLTCSDAVELTEFNGSNGPYSNFCVLNNSSEIDVADISCFTDGPAESGVLGRVIWFSFVAEAGTYTFTTTNDGSSENAQNDDTQMVIFEGECGALSEVPGACSDDIDVDNDNFLSQILDFQAEEGTRYYMLMDSWDDAEGEFGIEISFEPAPVANEAISQSSLELYPNPAADQLTISFDLSTAQQVNLQIRDITGAIVIDQAEQKPGGQQSINLNTEALANGSYIVSLMTEQGIVNKKLLIQ